MVISGIFHLATAHALTLSSFHPNHHSLWSWNMFPHSTVGEESGCILPVVSALCTTNFLEGLHFERRGPLTDQPPLTHRSVTLVWSPLATLPVMIHPWTTVELFRPVWSLCQGTETADQADHTTPCSGPLNQIWHHSTLVWQLLSPSAESSTYMEHAHRNGKLLATSTAGQGTW